MHAAAVNTIAPFSQSFLHRGIRRSEPGRGKAHNGKCSVGKKGYNGEYANVDGATLLVRAACSFLFAARAGRGDLRGRHQVADVLLEELVIRVQLVVFFFNSFDPVEYFE